MAGWLRQPPSGFVYLQVHSPAGVGGTAPARGAAAGAGLSAPSPRPPLGSVLGSALGAAAGASSPADACGVGTLPVLLGCAAGPQAALASALGAAAAAPSPAAAGGARTASASQDTAAGPALQGSAAGSAAAAGRLAAAGAGAADAGCCASEEGARGCGWVGGLTCVLSSQAGAAGQPAPSSFLPYTLLMPPKPTHLPTWVGAAAAGESGSPKPPDVSVSEVSLRSGKRRRARPCFRIVSRSSRGRCSSGCSAAPGTTAGAGAGAGAGASAAGSAAPGCEEVGASLAAAAAAAALALASALACSLASCSRCAEAGGRGGRRAVGCLTAM